MAELLGHPKGISIGPTRRSYGLSWRGPQKSARQKFATNVAIAPQFSKATKLPPRPNKSPTSRAPRSTAGSERCPCAPRHCRVAHHARNRRRCGHRRSANGAKNRRGRSASRVVDHAPRNSAAGTRSRGQCRPASAIPRRVQYLRGDGGGGTATGGASRSVR